MMSKAKCTNNLQSAVFCFMIFTGFIAGCSGSAAEPSQRDMNVSVVQKYFIALDKNDPAAIQNLFAADASQEFIGNAPLVGVAAILLQFQASEAQLQSMQTTCLTTVAEGDTVVVQVRHNAVFKSGGAIRTRIGVTPGLVIFSKATPITWRALAVFRIQNGKIVEEIIIRDELSMMMQMGTVVLQLP